MTTKKVGLLVVHGLGDQARGVTAARVVEGIERAAGERAVDHDEDRGRADHRLRVEGRDTDLRVYEVYWASILRDLGETRAFQIEMLQATAWLPWMNRVNGLYPAPGRGLLLVLLWTLFLVPLSACVYLAHQGAYFLLRILEGAFTAKGREAMRRGAGRQPTVLDGLLDRFVGDLYTYVHSAGALLDDEDRRVDAAATILATFRERLEAARDDGCTEIHVLAHSLGTVVTYHGLSRYLAADPTYERPPEVRHVHTIGSPLDKFRFFWPRLFPEEARVPIGAEGVAWSNFRHPMDFISGKLDHFGAVHNQRIFEGGVLRSHAIYFKNRRFLAQLTGSLFERPLVPRWSFGVLVSFVVSFFEIGLAALAFFLPAILGALLFAGILALVPWGLGRLVGLLSPSIGEGVTRYGWWFLLFGFGLGLVFAGRSRLRRRYGAWFPSLQRVIEIEAPPPEQG